MPDRSQVHKYRPSRRRTRLRLHIREAPPDEIESLIPLLLQAEESERALRWGLNNLVDAVYYAEEDGALVGAATMPPVGLYVSALSVIRERIMASRHLPPAVQRADHSSHHC